MSYIEDALKHAERLLPRWAYLVLKSLADAPTELSPEMLGQLSDGELRGIWLKLNQEYADAIEAKAPVEDVVNVALWVVDEMRHRGHTPDQTTLMSQIETLKSTTEDIVVVPNFVSIVGSAAKGAASPNDLDIVIRSKLNRESDEFGIQSSNIFLPLRNVWDPGKKDILHVIDNPQGPHSDHIELYDLVLRRKSDMRTTVVKAVPDEDETRGENAAANWEENWYKMLPKDGKGRFVYQHHWRGVEEDERKFTDSQLMDTSHSVHGDLRFEGNDGLWGFAVLIGDSSDNRNLPNQDKLIDMKTSSDSKLRLAPKLEQPQEWLDVGKGSPDVMEPGGVGATSQKWAKFFARDSGTYRLGVARKHSVEIFFDGGKLKGRYILQFAPVGPGGRVWLLDKPEDQTPTIETKTFEDEAKDVKSKGQDWLFWGGPGEPSKRYDVRTGEVAKSLNATVHICKADTVKKIVYGVVLDPYQIDAHGDHIPVATIEKTAHDWLKKYRLISLDHQMAANAYPVESWVEPYPSKADYENAVANKPHSAYMREFGDDTIHSGAWVLATQLDDELWDKYLAGEIQAYSIEGFGSRTPMDISAMPEVQFIDVTRGGV